jgi:hypothetical protein
MINICVVVDEGPKGVDVPVPSGPDQRRLSPLVRGIGIRALRNQIVDRIKLLLPRCRMQRRPTELQTMECTVRALREV